MNCARNCIMFLLVLNTGFVHAQKGDTSVVLSGVVVTGEYLHPVASAHIYIENRNVGTIANTDGTFAFTSQRSDTIRFSAIGFKDSYWVVPDTLSGNRYSLVQVMSNDTILLQETLIFPFLTYEDFKEELLTVDPPPTDEDRARYNLAQAQIYERAGEIYMDASANYNYVVRQRAEQAYYGGQVPPYQVFNVFAWVEFIKGWKRGDYKK
jgi:hypothetical protein